MKAVAALFVTIACAALTGCGGSADPAPPDGVAKATADAGKDARERSPLRFEMTRLDGSRENLRRYRGRVVLVVNTATECGFTPQFDGLQKLYESHRERGLVILGFPANDFAGQEPRTEKEIADFCEANYGVKFPMFAKVRVTGDGAHPLFRALGAPSWNFDKYLLDRRGRLVEHWDAGTEPADPELTGAVKRLL